MTGWGFIFRIPGDGSKFLHTYIYIHLIFVKLMWTCLTIGDFYATIRDFLQQLNKNFAA